LLVVERTATARELLELPPHPTERTLYLARPTDGAVILGSGQQHDDVNAVAAAALGLSVLRRRSGGGAVVVAPGRQLWLDLFVPASDPLFDRDVTRAAVPIGEAWRAALVAAGLFEDELEVHRGRLVSAPFSRQLCFLGLGPGEVTWRGKKLVGLSQRRGRAGAWFFSMAMTALVPPAEAAVLALDRAARQQVEAALADQVTLLPELSGFCERLVEALSAP
jgi:lipoate---protein ligase